MIVLLVILLAYLSWCVPQYIFHNISHKMIKEKVKNIISYGETRHHALGKNYFYNTEKDPELNWINVNKNMVLFNLMVVSLAVFLFSGFWISLIFLSSATFFSMVDLHIHQKVHMGEQGIVINFVRKLHAIHHKTWRHNYAIFFGIPIDIICGTFKKEI